MTTIAPQVGAGRREWMALAVLALPLLLVSMDVSVLYFAVPAITAELHASAAQQLWIFDIYGFVLAGLLITMGAVADRLGAKRVLLIGAACFSATSLAAAYAGSAGALIAARAVLGIAGATLMPSTLAMVRTMFHHERERARAVAVWTAVMTGGIGLGPVLGGFLLDHFWWGSVFLVNLPAMALLLLVGPVLLPATPARRGVPFDVTSVVMSLAAVLPTVYGVKEWAAHGLAVRWPLLIGAGLVVGALFVRRQLTHRHPLLPPGLLRNRRYTAAVAANAVATFAIVGNAVFMTAYLQLVLGKSALEAALWALAPTVLVGAAAPTATALAGRLGARRVATGGLLVGAGGFLILTRAGTDSLWLVLAGAAVLAVGMVSVMAVAGERLLGALEPEQAGVGSAVSEAATELGGALGIAVLGSLGAAAYRVSAGSGLPAGVLGTAARESLPGALAAARELPAPVAEAVVAAARSAYVHGLHVAATGGLVLLVVTAVLGWLATRRSMSRPGAS
ncbi:MFS transporter, DHA2 family, multidrug resistance protein [Nocardioides terrae]|uniref:MFS transporter, DHA2 family, multidrug resistance protein n=1 Tax=Nocardioides terrae TaxID=574651 RepID=A0A1I1EQS7_9ACTN|nr:MFS transporter [Nocardioides terrae]SFB89347.1 MFS transporter, DHA2 family, multidrug resistance protein [Nocardioides terrae]